MQINTGKTIIFPEIIYIYKHFTVKIIYIETSRAQILTNAENVFRKTFYSETIRVYEIRVHTVHIHSILFVALKFTMAKEADPTLGYLTRKDTEVKLPRPTRVKNKTPVPIQITVEQILREAPERQEAEIRPPKQKITDASELADYHLRKRKEFEDLIRRVRWNISVWIKYA